MAVQEAAAFTLRPAAGKESVTPVSVLCSVYQGSWDNMFPSFQGNCEAWGESSLFISFFPLLFFLYALHYLSLHHLLLSPHPLWAVWAGSRLFKLPPAAPLIVTATNNGPVERSSGAALSAEGRSPRYSKEAKVYLEERTANNHLCKPSQDCWVLE